MGDVGKGISSGVNASAPKASSSSACFVLLLLPSFIPEPLNAGARPEAGTGEPVLRAVEGSGASKR